MTPRSDQPPRRVLGFRRDEAGDWMAVLECGHTRHVRHRPPWRGRVWVLSEEGRRDMLSTVLGCARCADVAAPSSHPNPA